LQFEDGDSAVSLGLTGAEVFSVSGLAAGIEPRQSARVSADRQDGSRVAFDVTVRIDAPAEVEFFVNGGILPMVLRDLQST
jgi:aconitate hydratase